MDTFKKEFEKIKKESQEIQKEIRKKTVNYILAALGLIAGLAWNEFVKALIEHLFPLGKDTLWVKFVYALILTFIVVLVSVYLVRIFRVKTNQNKEGKNI